MAQGQWSSAPSPSYPPPQKKKKKKKPTSPPNRSLCPLLSPATVVVMSWNTTFWIWTCTGTHALTHGRRGGALYAMYSPTRKCISNSPRTPEGNARGAHMNQAGSLLQVKQAMSAEKIILRMCKSNEMLTSISQATRRVKR